MKFYNAYPNWRMFVWVCFTLCPNLLSDIHGLFISTSTCHWEIQLKNEGSEVVNLICIYISSNRNVVVLWNSEKLYTIASLEKLWSRVLQEPTALRFQQCQHQPNIAYLYCNYSQSISLAILSLSSKMKSLSMCRNQLHIRNVNL